MIQVGDSRLNTFGTQMKVIDILPNQRLRLQFCDEHMAVVETATPNYRAGTVKNPYDRTVFGVGYDGEGDHPIKVDGRHVPAYSVWMAMLQRCYSEKWKDRNTAYYGICTVCDEWMNFQKFARWYDEQYYEVDGRLHLDKDILVKNNKIYGPDRCLLVPQRINMIFHGKKRKVDVDLPTGIHRESKHGAVRYSSAFNGSLLGTFDTVEEAYSQYVNAKNVHIQKVADEYKKIIPTEVYLALVNYRCPTLRELQTTNV